MMTRRLRPVQSFLLLFTTALIPATAFSQRSGSTIPNDRIFEAIRVRQGATICEIGAGNGELTIAVAKLVGSSGRIFTSELGDERVKTLQQNVARSGLDNIEVVAGGTTSTNFPDGTCDALFMRNVYHHFTDPERMNMSIAGALKPGGRVAIVDFTPPKAEAATAADRAKDGTHGVSPDAVSREMTGAGFEPVSSELGEQRWFMVIVAKPAH